MNTRALQGTLVALAATTSACWSAAAEAPVDWLTRVRAYADCMLVQGQDTYGPQHSPLFAEALDRQRLRLLEGEALQRAEALKFEKWGIRPHDRMLGGANPQHCENLYQVLYALTAATGERKYAAAADASLCWFLAHCQSPATGLFWWGEHAGWDFLSEARLQIKAGNTHEFYRPWVLWDRCWEFQPDACRKFAVGLWEHQIGDQQTGDYSRHAGIESHAPGHNAPYARHGGFYIATWAKAYQKTKDPLFLRAITVVANGLDNDRREGGMFISRDRKTGTRTPFDVCFAVSLGEAAELVPDPLAGQLRAFATANDEAFIAAAPQPSKKAPAKASPDVSSTNLWSSGYGSSGGEVAGRANVCMLRYRQVKLDAYRKAVLAAAARYSQGPIDRRFPVYPGTAGKVLRLLLNAHELTGQAAYLDRADDVARQAIELFLDDNCPLPKATHVHDHYEAITGADTLMMSLLELWAARQKPPLRLSLIDTDR